MSRKKEFEIYGGMLLEHKPNFRSLLFNYLYENFLKRKRYKESIYLEDAKFRLPENKQVQDNLKYLAILNSKKQVIEIIRLNSETADMLLKPRNKMVEFDPKEKIVKIGMSYQDDSFIEKEKNEKDKI